VRTFYYVDGLNLYKRCLTAPGLKWLDLAELLRRELVTNEPVRIRYFTALVKARSGDFGSQERQRAYLSALLTIDGLSIHYGKIRADPTDMESVDRPGERVPVWHVREKGSDVNLAGRLFHDLALLSADFDAAVLVTHDSDQAETIRLARELTTKPVGVLDPAEDRAKELHSVASFYRRIHLRNVRAAQFPLRVQLPRGSVVTRPPEWADPTPEMRPTEEPIEEEPA
jgi:uncharacterized LabA/DUF88 family protein